MKKHILSSYLILALIAFALVGCFTVPDPLYPGIDADAENAKTPVINAVDRTSMWSTDILTITGSNFKSDSSENFVYFSTVSEPADGSTDVTVKTAVSDTTVTYTTPLRNVEVASSGYNVTVTITEGGVTTANTLMEAFSIEEYTVMDTDEVRSIKIETSPVFSYDTTSTSPLVIDTTGYTDMTVTETVISSISEWTRHTNLLGTVVSATPTELQVIPPELEASVLNAQITVQTQDAIAPAKWGYIDLLIKP